jgi:hypothetical membrane protein
VNVKIVKVLARFGTASPVIGAIIILLSISMSPEWSISQTLSDLGSEGFGSVLFNSGLLMSGSLAMLYAAGLFEFTKGDIVGQIGSAAFLFYALSTCILGIAVIDLGEIHNQIATLLFIMIPISGATLAYNLYSRNLTKCAVLGGVAAILGVTPWLMGGPVDAVKELIALIPISVLQIALGFHMYRLEEPEEFD